MLIYYILGPNELVLTNQTSKEYISKDLFFQKQNYDIFENLKKDELFSYIMDHDICNNINGLGIRLDWCDLDGGYGRNGLES